MWIQISELKICHKEHGEHKEKNKNIFLFSVRSVAMFFNLQSEIS